MCKVICRIIFPNEISISKDKCICNGDRFGQTAVLSKIEPFFFFLAFCFYLDRMKPPPLTFASRKGLRPKLPITMAHSSTELTTSLYSKQKCGKIQHTGMEPLNWSSEGKTNRSKIRGKESQECIQFISKQKKVPVESLTFNGSKMKRTAWKKRIVGKYTKILQDIRKNTKKGHSKQKTNKKLHFH